MNAEAARASQMAVAIKRAGVIAILRGDYPLPTVLAFANALLAGGVTALEVTLNSTAALTAVHTLSHSVGRRMLIGAGTARTADQARAAVAAGAQFVVSPNFDPAIATLADIGDWLYLPGVFTATEAQNAVNAGCRLLKLFPADAAGPRYLRALRAPLDDVDFVPTGGVNAANAADYARAGAAAVGVGSALLEGPDQPLAEVQARAAELKSVWDSAPHDRPTL